MIDGIRRCIRSLNLMHPMCGVLTCNKPTYWVPVRLPQRSYRYHRQNICAIGLIRHPGSVGRCEVLIVHPLDTYTVGGSGDPCAPCESIRLSVFRRCGVTILPCHNINLSINKYSGVP